MPIEALLEAAWNAPLFWKLAAAGLAYFGMLGVLWWDGRRKERLSSGQAPKRP